MKKTLSFLCAVLLLLTMAPAALAAEGNTDTLADWRITVAVPDDAAGAALKGSMYYIYAKKAGTIPYVMLTTYRYDSEEEFIEDFTEYMQRQYADLRVTTPARSRTIGGRTCREIVYGYTISGYEAVDRRIVMSVNGLIYLFGSKEIPSRGDTVGDMLDRVVSECVFLDEEGNALPELEDTEIMAAGYLYRTGDGMPKYWLDFTGGLADNLVLHCAFRSDGPTFYEQCYILDLEDADISDEAISIHTVTDMEGHDCSDWFRSLRLFRHGRNLRMEVRRNESTLAGGAEDNILTGTYDMEPTGGGVVYEYIRQDGLRKYWLTSDQKYVYLHAMFRSGEPTYHEEVFLLDLDSAEQGRYVLRFKKVLREDGTDVSHWFRTFALTEVQGGYMMNVNRYENTLAGGGDDNILTGVYGMVPRTFIRPLENGPYSVDELCAWAQVYYFTHNGFYPPEAEAERNADGTVTVHLFEVVNTDGTEHTATSAWYTVDAFGEGVNTVTEERVNLFS